MRFIDRVLAILIGLILIGVITIVAITPGTIRTALAGLEEANLVLRVAVVVVLNVLILVVLFLALRSPRKVVTGLAVRASGAYTDVSVESARKLILNAVENVADVVKANATVKAVNGKADVDLDVQVMGTDIHIPRKQKEIDRALRQVINKQLGLQMRGQPRVHIFLKGDEPPASLAVPEPAKIEEKPAPEPASAPTPKPQEVVAIGEDEDTLLKDDAPPKESKPGWLPIGILGRRDEAEVDSDAGDVGPDDLIDDEIDVDEDKETPEHE